MMLAVPGFRAAGASRLASSGFSLPDQDGKVHDLIDYRGQKVVLYFYPKDMSAGCTSQACSFADLYPQFREKGAVVLVEKDAVRRLFAEPDELVAEIVLAAVPGQ